MIIKNDVKPANDIILSIAILTMNRAEKLKDAIESCFDSVLPDATEFLIVDNGSTDGTKQVIENLFAASKYAMTYERLDINIGVGPGRNRLFDLANGKYIYWFDDDAIIALECQNIFFTKLIKIMNEYDKVATITSQIYDESWKCNRIEETEKNYRDIGQYKFMLSNGSCMMRKEIFTSPPYFNIRYGYEDLAPSLYAFDKGFVNLSILDIRIIHRPPIDKWSTDSDLRMRVSAIDCGMQYAIKSSIYPRICYAIVGFAYLARKKKHLSDEGRKMSKDIVKEFRKNNSNLRRLSLGSLYKLYKIFGLRVF